MMKCYERISSNSFHNLSAASSLVTGPGQVDRVGYQNSYRLLRNYFYLHIFHVLSSYTHVTLLSLSDTTGGTGCNKNAIIKDQCHGAPVPLPSAAERGNIRGPPEENQSIITLYISASVLMRFYEDLPSYGGELER